MSTQYSYTVPVLVYCVNFLNNFFLRIVLGVWCADAEGEDAVVIGTTGERSREQTRSPNEASKATLVDTTDGALPSAPLAESSDENATRTPEKTAGSAGEPDVLHMAAVMEEDRWEAATEPARRTQDKLSACACRPASSASLRRSGGGVGGGDGAGTNSGGSGRESPTAPKAPQEGAAVREAADEVPVKEPAENDNSQNLAAAAEQKLGERDPAAGAGEQPACGTENLLQDE